MTRLKLILVSLLAALALVGAACGGDSDEVPADAIAVVDGNAIDKSEFDSLIGQAKKSYELQKRDFPKVGSPEYNTLKNQAVQFLVQREQFEIKADELDVEVTDKQVDDRLTQIKKQYFQGSDKKYRDQLKQQGLTEESVKRDIRAQLVQEGIFKKVTEEPRSPTRRSRTTTTRTRRSTGRRSSVRSATSSFRRRSRRTTSTSSSRTAGTSPRSRRSSPRTRHPRRRAAS